jgi:ABC-type transport system substrate-binding protein
MDEPVALSSQLNAPAVRGIDAVELLPHAGLATADRAGVLRPGLAEGVPSVEDGGWQVFPDGRMQTTWGIKPSARWQDGTPLSADDILFTARVGQDRTLALLGDPAYDTIPKAERTRVLGEIMRHISERLTALASSTRPTRV